MKDNVHKGHRQRMKKEIILENRFEKVNDHRLLELLLFYGIPRIDTNPIAHELIEKFGSFDAVFDADIEELKKVSGMTDNAATLIKCILPMARRYAENKSVKNHKFSSFDDIGEFLVSRYVGYANETFAMTSFNKKGDKVAFDILSEGDLGTVSVTIRQIASIILKRKAAFVIISHNHVGANAVPSDTDIEMTIQLKEGIEQLGTRLLDHIIISGNDFVSMAQSREFYKIFK